MTPTRSFWRLSGVRRNAVLAGVQIAVTGIAMLVVYRFVIGRIGAKGVGLWATVLATSSFMRAGDFGFAGSAARFVAASSDDAQSIEVVETTAITMALLLALIILVVHRPFASILVHNIPRENSAAALSLLPYAFATVWINGLASTMQASIDGCHRADIRAIIVIAASLCYMLLAYLLTPVLGLVGLGIAQIGQSTVVAFVGWLVLRRLLPGLPPVPLRWNARCFRRMLHYGMSFQVITLSGLVVDPAAKLAVTRFGGLSATAYFDLAQRIVLQGRSLIVAANQVLVPRIAAVHRTLDTAGTRDLYIRSFRIVILAAVPMCILLAAAAPVFSLISIGRIERDFLVFMELMTAAYFVNILSGPGYFHGLGTGVMRWNVTSHLSQAILTLVFAFAFGHFFGGVGAVAGVALALVAASLVTIIGTSVHHRLPLRGLLPKAALEWRRGAAADRSS